MTLCGLCLLIFAAFQYHYCNATYTYVSPNSHCLLCDGSESKPYPTIKEGLDHSGSNILMMLPGIYKGSGNTNIKLTHSYKVITTKHPNDPTRTIIDCERNGWGFQMYSGAYSLIGLTVKNCIAPLRDISHQLSHQTLGGALFIQSVGSAKNISNCIFENNEADIGGGIYLYSASVLMNNVIVQNNKASNNSGGIHVTSGYLRLSNESIVRNNKADGKGGGMYLYSGTIELFNKSTVKSNTAEGGGQNIYCQNAHVNLYNDSWIDGNGAIVCNECVIKQFNNNNRVTKDFCPSNHPNTNSGKSNKKKAYLYTCLVIFIIMCLVGCCYFYKKRSNKYDGLLQT